jgi:hypothetical protein
LEKEECNGGMNARINSFTHDQIVSIKAIHPVPALFERDGHKLIRVGSLHKCLCPFHRERTPSCVVYSDHFYCYGCATHGDAITYVMKRDNCRFVNAVETLSGGRAVTFQAARRTPPRTLIREENLPPEYFDRLMDGYSRDTHPEDIYMLADDLGVDRDSLHRLRVAWAEEYRAFAIPMSNGRGETIGIRLRSNDGKKWAVKGSRQGLFIPTGSTSYDLAVSEGPTDCAAVLSMGMYCVGKAAAMQSPDELIEFIKRHRIQRVIAIADNDSAGVKGARKFMAACPVMACELILPTKDVRAFAQVGGSAELLRAMIKNQLWRRNDTIHNRMA